MSYFPDSPSMDSGYSSSDDESMAATETYTQVNDLAYLDHPSFQFDHLDTSMATSEMYTQPIDLTSLDLPSFQADHFVASEVYTQLNDLAPLDVPSYQVDHFDASITASEMYTQPNDLATLNLPNCKVKDFDTVPGHDNTYLIIEKASGKALHISDNELSLAYTHCLDDFALVFRWLCVEAENCFGFFNEETGMYVGYNDDMVMPVKNFDSYAYFTLRPHIDGGYMLQTDTGRPKKQVAVSSSNHKIVARQHAGTCFMFVKIEERLN
ncbi:hypothetical protein GGI43DRAFT_431056 [Trichoderma evansii]